MKQVDEISAKLTEPSVLPFTVAGGAVVAAIVGYSGWRFATGAREGELSAAQKAVAKKITSAMASGKRIHVRRVRQAEAGACAATVAKALVGDDSALPAMCPKGASSADVESRGTWLYSCMLAALAPSSTGAIVLRGDESSEPGAASPAAVVAVLPPGAAFPTTEFVCQGGWAYIARLTGWDRRLRFPGLGETLAAHRRRLTARFASGVYYVTVAAQAGASDAADKPLGALRATLAPVLAQADAEGKATYAETTSVNVADAYKALGFVEVEESRYAVFGVEYRLFVRAPHTGGVPAFSVSLDTLASL